jgi:hypothetical protein
MHTYNEEETENKATSLSPIISAIQLSNHINKAYTELQCSASCCEKQPIFSIPCICLCSALSIPSQRSMATKQQEQHMIALDILSLSLSLSKIQFFASNCHPHVFQRIFTYLFSHGHVLEIRVKNHP